MESLIYLVTLSGLMNGLNPCALGLMMTFLGYLIVFGGKKKGDRQILIWGGLYVFGVVLAYLLLGLVFYRLAYSWQRSVWVEAARFLIGGLMILFGLWQIKKAWRPGQLFEFSPYKKLGVWLGGLMRKINGLAAVVIGALTTVMAAPCTLPVYIGTAAAIAGSGMSKLGVLFYFIYYNLLFVLPLLVILALVYKGKDVMEMKEWSHKSEKVLRLLGGVLLLFLGWWVIR